MASRKEELRKAFYHQVAEEIKNGYFHPRIKDRAAAESKGNEKLAEGLYIKGRVEQLLERQTDRLWEMDKESRRKIRRNGRLIVLLSALILVALVYLVKSILKYIP